MAVSNGARRDRRSAEEKHLDQRLIAAREQVIRQITELINDSFPVGSQQMVAQRLRAILIAERRGTRTEIRAAVMELAVAAGTWAIALDVARDNGYGQSAYGPADNYREDEDALGR